MENIFPVNEIYHSIQGEGFHAGTPMVIVRLQGCGVGCPWCDTKYTWSLDPSKEISNYEKFDPGDKSLWMRMLPLDIVETITGDFPYCSWVLITGGEPALYNLAPLVKELHRAGFKVAIETSGTETGHVGAGFDWITVSPKIGMPGGKIISPLAISTADEIKFVVSTASKIETLKGLLEQNSCKSSVIVSLQPVSLSDKATKICIDAAMKYNWRVSLQLHKYLGVK